MAYNALSTSLPPDSRPLDEVTVSDMTSSYSSATMTGNKGTVSTMSQTPVAEVPLSSAGDPPRQESMFEKHGRPPASKKPDRTQYRVFTHFQWEILSILLSVGIIVAMYVLLIEYNNKLVSDWEFPINLTTLLALMSTIMRAALFVPITSIISQAKWQLFGGDRPRPLQELQDIDMGSRGMLGALNIVPLAARASIPTLVAVLLSIVSLGIGPFVQQALRTVPCDQIVPGQAMVPYTHFVNSPRFVVPNTAYAQSDIQAMMYNTLAMPDDQGNEIRFQCPTGNCTFNNGSPAWSHQRPGSGPQRNGSSVFSTMAMCHKCLDMTDKVHFEERIISSTVTQLNPKLPNGLELQLGGADMIGMGRPPKFLSMTGNVTWANDKLDKEALYIASMSMGNVTILAHDNERDDRQQDVTEMRKSVVASTCFLYACTRTFNVSIANGELSEELIDTAPATSGPTVLKDDDTYPTRGYEVIMSPCWVGDNVYTLAKEPDRDSDRLGDVWSCSRNGTQVPAEKCGGTPDVQQCYYKQDAKHAFGMIGAFRKSFNVECLNVKEAIVCYDEKDYHSGTSTQGDHGQGSWAESMYAANVTHQKIDDMFDRFATIVSNRYRMTFGGSKPSFIESMTEGPYGQVRGMVQQTTVCNAVRLEWLAFPAAIMALTLAILLWTMLESWLHRKDRPVWKDSILPFLLYNHRFKREARDAGNGSPVVVGENRDMYGTGSSSSPHDNKTLLETGEMEDIARDMHVRIEWPKTGKRRDVEVDSLMCE